MLLVVRALWAMLVFITMIVPADVTGLSAWLKLELDGGMDQGITISEQMAKLGQKLTSRSLRFVHYVRRQTVLATS